MNLVVVTGARGLLGRALVIAFRAVGDRVVGLTHSDIDLELPSSLERISEIHPDVVVNAAAWTDVDGCARDPERAMRINGTGAGLLADAAARVGAAVVQLSTNEVFDGREARPYAEDDAPNPVNPYGRAKLVGEQAVADATDRHLVIRTAWLFNSERGFPARIRTGAERAMAADEPLAVVADEWGNPTPVSALATAIVIAAQLISTTQVWRTVHLAGEPPISRLGWAREVLADLPVRLKPISQAEYPRLSRVPPHAVLALDRARALGLPAIDWRLTTTHAAP